MEIEIFGLDVDNNCKPFIKVNDTMETPIQILSEVDKDVHYTPRQLNAVKEMAFRFATKVLVKYLNESDSDTINLDMDETHANGVINEMVPGRDEKYDQDNNKTITEQ
jgi:hypothetical protein